MASPGAPARAPAGRLISPPIARLGGGRALARVHREVGHHLVVARARGVQPPADRPGDLGQAALDRHVDVLVAGREREAALAQLLLDRVESREQRLAGPRR